MRQRLPQRLSVLTFSLSSGSHGNFDFKNAPILVLFQRWLDRPDALPHFPQNHILQDGIVLFFIDHQRRVSSLQSAAAEEKEKKTKKQKTPVLTYNN